MRKIIAVDFDGTLCENAYPSIGKSKIKVIDRLKLEKVRGAILVLWTCREGETLNEAIKWCERYGLYFDAVNDNPECAKAEWGNNPRKVYADEYWDDHNANMEDLK